MKKVEPGATSKSYGIDVAKLAGIPDPVLELARGFLHDLQHEAPSQPSLFVDRGIGDTSIRGEESQ